MRPVTHSLGSPASTSKLKAARQVVVVVVVVGGKAKPAEKATNCKAAPKAAAKAETITDLRKLNEHLSTRSYFGGGHKPSQADVAQLAATPDNISCEQFPPRSTLVQGTSAPSHRRRKLLGRSLNKQAPKFQQSRTERSATQWRKP